MNETPQDNDSADVVVHVDALSKTYDADAAATPALDGVSLDLRAGEAVAVMGPSGCGKSTLLNMIAGLDRPSHGTVSVYGEDLGRLSESALARFRRRRIGMVFQFFNLLDDLTALDNVALAGQLIGGAGRQARARAEGLLDALDVAERAHAYPALLSGGERQRVALARALMNRPALLLADEPTGALDSRAGGQVVELLRELNAGGQTLLLVTHDQRVAAGCADRVVEMADGRVVGERTPDEVGQAGQHGRQAVA